MRPFRLKYPDLYRCLAKPTDLRCFVASQPIIKFTNFHGQFLFKKLPLADKKYFLEPCALSSSGATGSSPSSPPQAKIAKSNAVCNLSNYTHSLLILEQISFLSSHVR